MSVKYFQSGLFFSFIAGLFVLFMSAPPAQAGRANYVYCPTGSSPTAVLNYDNPDYSFDDYEEATGSNQAGRFDSYAPQSVMRLDSANNNTTFNNTNDDDYPGWESTVTRKVANGNQGDNTSQNDVAANSDYDRFDHNLTCSNTQGFFEIAGDKSGNALPSNAGNPISARWKIYAPKGVPGDAYDTGYWAGKSEWRGTFGTTGVANNNSATLVWETQNQLIRSRNANNGEAQGTYTGRLRYQDRTQANLSSGGNQLWRSLNWDLANNFTNEFYDNQTLNASSVGGVMSDFNVRLECNTTIPGNCGQSNNSGASFTTPQAQLRDAQFWVEDNESPFINYSSAGFFDGNWKNPNAAVRSGDSGNPLYESPLENSQMRDATINMDVYDAGNGIDAATFNFNGTSTPFQSEAAYGLQPCRFLSGVTNPAQPSTQRPSSGEWESWTVANSSNTDPYDPGMIGYYTGPCNPQASLRNINANTAPFAWQEGVNTFQTYARDFYTRDDRDSNKIAGTTNGAANEVYESKQIFRDTTSPANLNIGTRAVLDASDSPTTSYNANTGVDIMNGAYDPAPYEIGYVHDNFNVVSNAFDINSSQANGYIAGLKTNRIDVRLQNGTSQTVYRNCAYSALAPCANGASASPSNVAKPGNDMWRREVVTTTGVFSTNIVVGNYTVYPDGTILRINATPMDWAGNATTTGDAFRIVDNTDPVNTTAATPGGWVSNLNVSTSANDATSGIHHVECRVYNNTNGNLIATPATDETPNANGGEETSCNYNITQNYERLDYKYFDNAGNVTQTFSIDPNIDPTNPTANASCPPAPSWSQANVTCTITGSDTGGSGLASLQYRTQSNGGAWSGYTSIANGGTFVVSTEGTTIVEARATDGSGRVGTSAQVSVKVDKQNPTISASCPPAPNWTNANVSCTVSANDPGSNPSGISNRQYRTQYNGGAWSGYTSIAQNGTFSITQEGTTLVDTLATDVSGRQGAGTQQTVRIDKTAPSTSLSCPPAPSWSTTNVTCTVSASDALSGVQNREYRVNGGAWQSIAQGGTYLISSEGTTTVEARSTDNASNVSPIVSQTVRVDKTAPTAQASCPPAPGWSNANVTCTFSFSDSGSSGLNLTQYRVDGGAWTNTTNGGTWVKSSEGSQTVEVRSTDNAGNASSIPSVIVRVDKTAPSTSLSCPPAPAWSQSQVTCTVSASDSLSGVAERQYRVDGGAWTVIAQNGTFQVEEGEHYVEARSFDNANNASATVDATPRVDLTNPSVSLQNPGSVVRNSVNLDATASDTPSGIDNVVIQRSPAGSGTWTDIETSPSYARLVQDRGPRGYWKLNDQTKPYFLDSTNVLSHGTWGAGVSSSALYPPIRGADRSFYFSNDNQWRPATIADNTTLDLINSDQTIAFWYYQGGLGDTTQWRQLVNKDGSTCADRGYGFWLTPSTAAGNGGRIHYSVKDCAGLISTSEMSTGWHHIAGTYNKDTGLMRLYIDGVMEASATVATGGAPGNVQPLNIGANAPQGTRITDVAIDNQDWSANQIQAMYNASDPYRASWDTTAVSDGLYDVRAVATDFSGRQSVSTRTTRVDNTAPSTNLSCPPAPAWSQNNVTCTVSASDSGSGVASREYRTQTNGGSWSAWTSIAQNGTFQVSTEGTTQVEARSTDNGGLQSPVVSQTVRVDKTIPTASVNCNPNNTWNNTNSTCTFGFADPGTYASGLATTQYRVNGGAWTNTSNGGNVVVSAEGTNTVEARSIDNAGNVSSIPSQTVRIDKTNPSAGINCSPNNTWNNSNVTCTFSFADTGGSGLNLTQYRIDGGAWINTTNGGTYVDTTDGTTTVEARSTDNAGNASPIPSQTVRIDKAAPKTGLSGTPGRTNLLKDPGLENPSLYSYWYDWQGTSARSTANLAPGTTGSYSRRMVTAASNSAVYTGWGSQTDGAVPGATYSGSMYVYNANSSSRSVNFVLRFFKADGTMISDLGAQAYTIPANSGQRISTQAVTAPAATTNVGLVPYLGNGSGVSGDVWFVDDALVTAEPTPGAYFDGRSAGASWLDQADSSASFIPGDASWIQDNGQFTMTDIEAASGMASREYRTRVNSGAWSSWTNTNASGTVVAATQEGSTDLEYRATDNAGNTSAVRQSTIRIDKTNPTAAVNCSPNASWNNTNSTCTFTFADPGAYASGLATTQYRVNGGAWTSIASGGTAVISQEGINTIEARSFDNSGRASAVASQTVRIDKTNPTINVSCPPSPSWSTSDVTCTVSAADPGTNASGVASRQYRINGGSWQSIAQGGTFTITTNGETLVEARSTDNATNQSPIANVTVRIDKTGVQASMKDPSPNSNFLRQNFTPTATINGGVSGVASWVVEDRVNSGTWTTVPGCNLNGSTVRCAVKDISAINDGSQYSIRVSVQNNAGASLTSVQTNTIDKTEPVDAPVDPTPSSPWLRGTFTPQGTVSDPTSGPQSATLQERLNTGSWDDLSGCSLVSGNVSCSNYDTTTRSDGTIQDLRVRSADNANNDKYSRQVLNDNPLGYYALNENSGAAIDEGSGSNDSNFNSSGVTQGQAGAPVTGNRKAYSFSSNGYIQIPDDSAHDQLSPQQTIETWVYLDSYGDTSTWRNFAYKGSAAEDRQFWLGLNKDTQGQILYGIGTEAGQYPGVASGSTQLQLGQWYHVVGTTDSSNFRLYINGQLVGQAANTFGAPSTGDTPLYLGSAANTSLRLDEFAMYGTRLTAAQIQAHYDASSPVVSNTIDNTAPTPQANCSPSNSWNTTNVTCTVSAVDALSGVASREYRTQINGGSWSGWTPIAQNGTFLVSTEGTTNAEVRATDNAGNVSSPISRTIRIDKTNPLASVSCPPAPAWSQNNVTCTISSSDPGANASGLSSTEYRTQTNGGSWSSWTSSSNGGTFVVSTEGTTQVEVRSTDNAARLSTVAQQTVRVDKTNPLASVSCPPAPAISQNDVTCTVTSSDPGAYASGLQSTEYRINGGSWQATSNGGTFQITQEGSTQVEVRSTDNSGRTSPIASQTVRIDKTDPALGLTGEPGRTNMYNNTSFTPNINGTSTYMNTVVHSNEQARFGTYSAKYTINNDTQNPAYGSWIAAQSANVQSSTPYYLSTWVYSSIDDRYRIGVREYNSSDISLGDNYQSNSYVDVPANTWTEVSAVVTTNANSAKAGVLIRPDGTQPVGTNVYIDGVVVAPGSNPVSFFSGESSGASWLSTAHNSPSVKPGDSSWMQDNSVFALTYEDAGSNTSGLQASEYRTRVNGGAWGSWTSAQFSGQVIEATQEGSTDMEARVIDNSGRTINASQTIRIDKTDPLASVNCVPNNSWNNTNSTCTITSSDPGTYASGLALTQYRVNGGSWTSINSGNTVVLSQEGTNTIEARSTDNAGRTSPIAQQTIRIDKTNPTAAVNCVPNNSWNNTNSTCTITSNDPGANASGVALTEYRVNNGAWTAISSGGTTQLSQEGTNTIDARSTDNAGNVSTIASQTVRIDKTNPLASVNCVPNNSWNNTNSTCTITSSDSGSGLASTQYRVTSNGTQGAWTTIASGGTTVLSTEGTNLIEARSTDNAGNSSPVASQTVRIDKTNPTAAVNCSPNASWNQGNSTCTVTSADPGTYASGVSSTQYRVTANGSAGSWTNIASGGTVVLSQEGTNLIEARSFDNAGNASSVSSQTVRIDKTNPTASVSCPPAPAWSNANVTCTISGADSGTYASGVASREYRIQTNGGSYSGWTTIAQNGTFQISTEGTSLVEARSTDNSGRVSSVASQTVRIDKQAPSATISCPPAPAWKSSDVTCTVSGSDSGTYASGVASREYRLDGGSWTSIAQNGTFNVTQEGPHFVEARSTDNAGNVSAIVSQTPRVDKTNPSVALDDPGNRVSGEVELNAQSQDTPSGVSNVRFERSPSGAGNWSTIATSKSYPRSVIDNSPLAYYRLDETSGTRVYDEIGENHGTRSNATFSTAGSLRAPNNAYDFSANGQVEVPHNSAFNGTSNQQTIETWVYLNSYGNTSTFRPIAYKGLNYLERNFYLGLNQNTNGQLVYGVGNSTAGYPYILSSSQLQLNQWYHVTATMNSSEMRLYINGQPVGQAANNFGNASSGTTPLFLGGPGSTSMKLDELAVYGSALSQSQIEAHYNARNNYTGAWDTTSLTDGLYDLRAVSTDISGRSSTSTTRTTRVDNNGPEVHLTGTHVNNNWYRGSQLVTGTATDGGGEGVDKVYVQTRPANGTTWTTSQAPCNNMTNTSGINYECNWNSTQLQDGDYDLRLQGTDLGGRVGSSPEVVRIRIDNTNPNGDLTATSSPATPSPYLRGVVTLLSDASDSGSGVNYVRIERSPQGTGNWTDLCTKNAQPYSCDFDSTAFSEGTRFDFRAVIVDNVGNQSTVSLNDRMVDNTAPGQNLAGYNSGWQTANQSLTLTATGETPGSGKANVQYRTQVNGGAWSSWTTQTTPSGDPSAAIAITQEGTTLLETRATDNATNQSSAQSYTIRIDKQNPNTTLTCPSNAWRNTNASCSVSATDPGTYASGVASRQYRTQLNGGAWSAWTTITQGGSFNVTQEGTTNIQARSYDVAGRVSSTQSATLNIDKTAPIDNTSAPSTWQNNSVTVTVQGADALSGVAGVEWRINGGSIQSGLNLSQVTIEEEGTTTLETRITDNATNQSIWKVHVIRIDKNPPTLEVDGSSTNWFNTNRQITLTANDGGGSSSRIQYIEWRYVNPSSDSGFSDVKNGTALNSGNADPFVRQLNFVVPDDEAADRYLQARAVDNSGQNSGWKDVYVRIDKVDPELSLSLGVGQGNNRVEDVFGLMGPNVDIHSGPASGHFEVCRGNACEGDNGEQADKGNWTTIDQAAYLDILEPRCQGSMSLVNGSYTCNFDSRRYANGTYYLRTYGTDAAGNDGYSDPINPLRFRNDGVCPVSL